MSWQLALCLYTVLLGFTIAGGLAVGTAMGLVGIVGVSMVSGTLLWPSFGEIVWNNVNSFTLVAVPLFVLMGEIILRSGASRRFYMGVSVLTNRVPGGLAQSNIVACALFSAISGSSTATALTIGTVALPEMRRRGYADAITLGTLTGGGALGNLIPPSIFLLVYAAVVQQSVVDLFVATIVPGIVAVAMFMLYVGVRVIRNPRLVPPRAPAHTPRQVLAAVGACGPVTLLILAIIGGMYWGVVTPTEAAGFGCLLSLGLALVYREMTPHAFYAGLKASVAVTCVVMFVIINGQVLSFAIVQSGIGRGLAKALVDLGLSPFLFFAALFLFYLLLGTFLDGISMMLLTVPVIHPALRTMGFDDVWFGVILVIQAELAQLSPPIGLNLFAVQSIARDVDLATISWASLPYAVMLGLLSFLLYAQPDLALGLVRAMKG
ncbi:MAG: TRAP transporter large permease [Alphaproteobacteria bacterium]|nr:TRAP transporter large permease [Alphaproteobacteria bacterium]